MKKSILKTWNWIDDRTGISEAIMPALNHPVPTSSTGWWYVFGSATAFCLSLQVITGICLALMYQPSSGTAYASLRFINSVPFAHFLRSVHFFGASGMILLMGLHMIRVFVMAAYKFPREMQWITGVILLALTIGMGFTGQMLRWDADGVWAAVVAADQASRVPFIGHFLAHFFIGGNTMGGQTLSRFYAFHVFWLPAVLFLFVGIHIYMVLRNGITEAPKSGNPVIPEKYRAWYKNMLETKGVPYFPDAAWHEMLFMLLTLIVIILLAVFFGAPRLGPPPDPSFINVVPAPDWYLTWIFALYALMPYGIEDYVIVLGPLVIGIILFAIPFVFGKGEKAPMKRPWSMTGVLAVVVFVLAFWWMGWKTPWVPDFATKPLPTTIVAKKNEEAQAGVKLFYVQGCQYCHSIGPRGGHKGPNLTYVADKLTPRQMKVYIINGSHNNGGMPSFGSVLTNTQLGNIIAFLKTRKQGNVKGLKVLNKQPESGEQESY
jgi:ubiquinol-cytochrome c reductase cytochrome b subunit